MAKDSEIKVKVGIVGPCEAGKTTLANFLADATETVIEDYNPTHVVRILEFDSVNVLSISMFFQAQENCNLLFEYFVME